MKESVARVVSTVVTLSVGVAVSVAPNLLVISDLHLGGGLGGPGAGPGPAIDRELVAFLRHYTVVQRNDRPWRLVINGDMVDFIGVLLKPTGDAPDPEDATWGLGPREEAAETKMLAVIAHHRAVFDALAAFVASGSEISVVIGNHDAEFHFPRVQARFREAIAAALPTGHGLSLHRAIAFHPWFFFERDVAWIEHGHQYDPYCSFTDVLEPATDRREIDPNVGSALVRYVMNHLAFDIGDQYADGFWAHLRFAASQGVRGGLGVVGGYLGMVRKLLGFWRTRRDAADRRERSRRRMLALARRFQLPVSLLSRVRELWVPPVVDDLGRLVRAMMLDRLVVLCVTPFLLLSPFVTPWEWLPFAAIGSGAVFAAGLREALKARETPDPRAAMSEISKRLREAVRVPVVVFGHTHAPAAERHDARGGYFNTGTWAAHGSAQAFSHVVIERKPGRVEASLLRWVDGESRSLE
jgi:UDP-2,3-diacylglucosamine pyrophosphatase LpxH